MQLGQHKMKIQYSSIIPFKGFYAINLFGVLFIRKEYKDRPVSKRTLNHESIHSTQAKDFCKITWIGYILFYILYFLFWIIEIIRPPYDEAYHDVCFEKEAYLNEDNLDYLNTRKRWDWTKKIYWRNYDKPKIKKYE